MISLIEIIDGPLDSAERNSISFAGLSFLKAAYSYSGRNTELAQSVLHTHAPIHVLPSCLKDVLRHLQIPGLLIAAGQIEKDLRAGIIHEIYFDDDEVSGIAANWPKSANLKINYKDVSVRLLRSIERRDWLNLTAARVIDANWYFTFNLAERKLATRFGMNPL